MRRITSGPASMSAEPTATSAPRTAQRRASGRSSAIRARERDGDGTPIATSFLVAAARVEGVYAFRMEEDQEQLSVEPAELVEDELLVEEISIDGMCGVY